MIWRRRQFRAVRAHEARSQLAHRIGLDGLAHGLYRQRYNVALFGVRVDREPGSLSRPVFAAYAAGLEITSQQKDKSGVWPLRSLDRKGVGRLLVADWQQQHAFLLKLVLALSRYRVAREAQPAVLSCTAT